LQKKKKKARKTSVRKHAEPTYPVVSSCDFTTETIGENRRQRSEDTATMFLPTGQRAGADGGELEPEKEAAP
jgi:hypothetical protein